MNEPLLLNGKKVTDELYSKLPNMNGKELAIITIGDDEASKVYVRNKIKACERVGLVGRNYKFNPSDYKNTQELAVDIINTIEYLNAEYDVVGIMIQQPYPRRFNMYNLESFISFNKDVDGLCDYNMLKTLRGKLNSEDEKYVEPIHHPATPKGIITLLDYYNIPIEGKNVVIIGRSEIVGKPLAAMMTARNATVTLCHSKTKDLKEYTRKADIIVSAVGKAKFINSDYLITKKCIKEYAEGYSIVPVEECNYPVIIDVGINRDENGKLCGDIDYEDILPYVGAITPVPGGVGPMTVYSLIENCCKNE